MPKNYELAEREDPRDRRRLDDLKDRIFKAQRTVEEGFLKLMQGIAELRESKLYRLDGMTFKEFCDRSLNMSYKTVNGLLKIREMALLYPERFDEKTILAFGHRKMKTITYGVAKITQDVSDYKNARDRIDRLLDRVDDSMTAPQIDEIVRDETRSE